MSKQHRRMLQVERRNKLNMFNLFRLCRKYRSTCSIRQCCFDSTLLLLWTALSSHRASSSSSLWSLQTGGGASQHWLLTTASYMTCSSASHVAARPRDTWLITDLIWLSSNNTETATATTTTTTTTTITPRPHVRLVVVDTTNLAFRILYFLHFQRPRHSDISGLCWSQWFCSGFSLCNRELSYLLHFSTLIESIFTARRHVSVYPSVCLSVTRRYCIKTAERRITQTTPYEVYCWCQRSRQNSNGVTPNGG